MKFTEDPPGTIDLGKEFPQPLLGFGGPCLLVMKWRSKAAALESRLRRCTMMEKVTTASFVMDQIQFFGYSYRKCCKIAGLGHSCQACNTEIGRSTLGLLLCNIGQGNRSQNGDFSSMKFK